MICKKCGELIGDNDRFCGSCGAPQQQRQTSSVLNPQHVHRENCTAQGHTEKNSVGFLQAVALYFKNYVNFKGRSRRSEYWWAWLFTILVSSILTTAMPDIAGLWTLVTCIPTLSLAIRRLHDIGKSGWWYLIGVIPLVGSILMLIWACKDSQPETNQWGPCPKN